MCGFSFSPLNLALIPNDEHNLIEKPIVEKGNNRKNKREPKFVAEIVTG